MVAKVEWHQGELFPRVAFIVTNLSYPTIGIVRFYNGRGTAEQWIKEGKYALNWTRLSCHKSMADSGQTPSGISEAASIELGFDDLLVAFPLPWSAYVRLLSVRNESAAFDALGMYLTRV